MSKVIHFTTWGGFQACLYKDAKAVFNNKASYDEELERVTCPECHKKITYEEKVSKKSLKELTKDELLSFIYNHPPGNVNIFDPLAGCFVCGQEETMYGYQCQKCQELDENE